jgi:hypothetical protein
MFRYLSILGSVEKLNECGSQRTIEAQPRVQRQLDKFHSTLTALHPGYPAQLNG